MSEVVICKLCDQKTCKPGRKQCHRCRSSNYRLKFPVRKVFYDLRSSAKKRKIEFQITLPDFEKWIKTTGYMENRGRGADNLNIDRREEGGVYSIKNIQCITKSENSKKYHESLRKYEEELMKDVPF